VSVQAAFADGDPIQVVEYRRRPSLRDLLLGATSRAPGDLSQAAAKLLTAATGPRFLYYWQGAR
jgi:hypothetical protein